jgi:ABC-type bacteriocin/lantibiotic exporter with double-glycine peptidase domain
VTTLHRVLLTLALVSCSACSAYTGAARPLRHDAFRQEPGWIFVRHVPLLRQAGDLDCGPTALAMVVDYYRPELRGSPLLAAYPDRRASAGDLRDRARALGLHAFVVDGSPEDLAHELQSGRPVIVGMAKPTVQGAVSHFEVVIGIHPQSRRIATFDPAAGWRQNSLLDFMTEWQATGRVLLVVMPVAPAELRAAGD